MAERYTNRFTGKVVLHVASSEPHWDRRKPWGRLFYRRDTITPCACPWDAHLPGRCKREAQVRMRNGAPFCIECASLNCKGSA